MVKRVDAEISYLVLISALNSYNHKPSNKFLQLCMPQFPTGQVRKIVYVLCRVGIRMMCDHRVKHLENCLNIVQTL